MITVNEIKDILRNHESKRYSWLGKEEGRCLRTEDYDAFAVELLGKLLENEQENAGLSAKVKAYEAIIENSNFKMAVVRSKK